MAEGQYFVKLKLGGTWLDSSKYCGDNPTAYACSVNVSTIFIASFKDYWQKLKLVR